MRDRQFFRFFLVFFLFSFAGLNAEAKDLLLQKNVTIYADVNPGSAVKIAMDALIRDLKSVINAEVRVKPLSEIRESGIVIFDNSASGTLPKTVSGYESHAVYVKNIRNVPQAVLEGADQRGTIYSIYTFSEKILGVPPLWYFSSWHARERTHISIPVNTRFNFAGPAVKYRAWFPNDTDLFEPWRKRGDDNYKLWLETALRLKLNTIEWFDDERDYSEKFSVSRTTKLISEYGLLNTTHHHSPLNASFAGWKDYWTKVKHTESPALSLANTRELEEFWRYNVESVVHNNIPMLWVLGFRGNGDHPFWYSFKDAPESMKERGEIISKMMEKQRQIILEVTKDSKTPMRTIFYDELSDLLAKGFITPPADSDFIRTYVAARRDHFPNLDIQQLDRRKNATLGYYFNYQFTSTGSHLAAAEGPWKMEHNFRYVAGKSNKPIAFSVVNAGNLREHLMELSANAAMMWDIQNFSSEKFISEYCKAYYGQKHGKEISELYARYYDAYWMQRKSDFPGMKRQYIFQDLRYNKALKDLINAFNKPFNTNPLPDIPAEQVKGRTYNIVPADNNAATVLDALISGTEGSSKSFYKVAQDAEEIYLHLAEDNRPFFSDNIRQPAWYMYHLNRSLLSLALGYKETGKTERRRLVKESLDELHEARNALKITEHSRFDNWYAGDRVFGFNSLFEKLEMLLK